MRVEMGLSHGAVRRFAPLQFRAAGKRQVEGAVEGLERLLG